MLQDTSASEAASVALADLLDDWMVARPAERARVRAAEGGLKLLGDGGLPQSIIEPVIGGTGESRVPAAQTGRPGDKRRACGKRRPWSTARTSPLTAQPYVKRPAPNRADTARQADTSSRPP
ncbi:hypothetical protein ACFYPC_27485 [Streptomyces sp. NPDC005808]|uniref:hypothetical protein n=1 Tax=Streptomyces sp. NPDC005808 TaxID=3364734 RepID=UPI0036CB57EC